MRKTRARKEDSILIHVSDDEVVTVKVVGIVAWKAADLLVGAPKRMRIETVPGSKNVQGIRRIET